MKFQVKDIDWCIEREDVEENLEAVKNGVLKNRLVTGNYDDFKLEPGVNTINYDGIVEKIIVNDYSRWL